MMTEDAFSFPAADTALTALAVFGQADTKALAALLSDATSAGTTGTPVPSSLAVLANHPAVRQHDDGWTLTPDVVGAILADLERKDPARFRLLHERAITYLIERLRAGDTSVEAAFVRVFDRLASRLLSDDPEGFSALVRSVQAVPLASPASRQLRRYFEGVALARADRYAEALAVLDGLLAERDLDEQVRGRALNSRAIYCYLTGRLEEAVAGYRASLALWQRLGDRLNEGKAWQNLGIIAYELREYDEAESSLAQAIECFEETGSSQWLAAVRNELGLLYRDRGRWPEALTCFEAAATYYRAQGAHDYLGRALNNIGEVLLFQGRLAEAVATLQEALATMTSRVFAIDTHLYLGLAHQAAGDLPAARDAFQAALDLALAIGRRDILAEVHYRLGEALRRQGDHAAALTQFEAGAQVIESTREPLRDERLKISLLGRWQQVYEALVLHGLDTGRPALAVLWAERARARAFADAVVQRRALSTQGPPAPSTEGVDGDGVEHALTVPPVTGAEVQAALSADTTVLCYFTTGVLEQDLPLLRSLSPDNPLREHLLTPPRTLLFVITQDGVRGLDCGIDPNAFVSASLRPDDRTRFLTPAVLRRLHTALLAPAGQALASHRLWIIPHGPLHAIPFGALLDEQGLPLLHAAGPQVTYTPSVTLLLHQSLRARSESRQQHLCLAIGYDGADGGRTLRHTEAEAKSVADLTGGEAWLGPAPKKDRLRRAAGGHRWLHFACHGWFNHDTPLDSYLETGAGERLTALEVLQEWRLQAELVTLSACQTGVSRILRGDEPMGLVRAFLSAGAGAVLVTQWPVDDLPTFLLMQRFYSELLRGQAVAPARALQTAQLWLRELTTAEARELLMTVPVRSGPADGPDPLGGLPPDARPFAHPRHWAGFILVGGM